jgi:hypothetical protein
MSDETAALGRVALARALPRLLALPAGLAVAAFAVAATGVVAWGAVGAGVAAVLVLVGVVLLVSAFVLVRVPLTTRLDVEPGRLTVAWLGGARHYELVRGAVTRVTLAGDDGRVVRSRTDPLGWTVGEAVLRGEERIHAVRLAATPTMILVPTDHGRLAIAAASEAELVAALSAAARVRQRMQEAVAAAPALPAPAPPARPARDAAEEPGDTAVLTGIERARREAELAAAREAALVAARAELATQGAALPAPSSVRREEPAHPMEREVPWSRPSAARQRHRATWTRPAWATPRVVAALVAVAWALVPLAAAGGTWLVAQGVGPGSATWNKMLTLALALGGPAAALAVLAVRAWWPRLTGLVTTTSVAALIMVARAVAG